MRNLYQADVNLSTVDNLVSGTLVPMKVVACELSGTGIIKRGTPLVYDDTNNVYEEATDDIDGILLLDIDADDPDEALGAPVAFCGEFNQNKIEEVTGAGLADEDIAAARKHMIFIAPMAPAPEPFI